MRIPLDNWASYESSLEDRPIFTKTLINVIIYLLGDWLSQTLFQKKNVLEFDASRTLKNGFIGLCFGPLVHEYYQFSDYILPVEGGIWNRLEKILMDQTLYLTVKCSVYIAAVGLLQGESWEQVQDNVKSRIKGIVFAAWKFWPLVRLRGSSLDYCCFTNSGTRLLGSLHHLQRHSSPTPNSLGQFCRLGLECNISEYVQRASAFPR